MKKLFENTYFVYMAAILSNFIWGFSNTLTGIALQVSVPQLVLATRFLCAILLMAALVAMGKEHLNFRKPQLFKLISLGVIELIYFYCESYGIIYTNVTCSGVILAASPIVSIIFAVIFLKEVPTKWQVFFSLVTVVGVILITVAEGIAGEIQPIGVVLLCIGCLCTAAFRVINRGILHIYTAFERTFVVLFVSFVVFFINGLIQIAQDTSVFFNVAFSLKFWLPVLGLGIFSSFGANIMMNNVAEKLTVVEVSVFGAICTICSMIGGVVILGEPISLMSIIGVVMIVVGIWQVNKEQG